MYLAVVLKNPFLVGKTPKGIFYDSLLWTFLKSFKEIFMMKYLLLFCSITIFYFPSNCQETSASPLAVYWKITKDQSIRWNLTNEKKLPHAENIEMSGKNMAAIIYYDIDTSHQLTLKRDVILPQLRTFNKTNEPDWKKYRAYFRRTISDEILPTINVGKKIVVPAQVDSVEIRGMLKFYHTPINGLQITRTLYPSMEDRFLVEKWEVKNIGKENIAIQIENSSLAFKEVGYKGTYTFHAFSDAPSQTDLAPGKSIIFPIYFGGTLNDEQPEKFNYKKAEKERIFFLVEMSSNLHLNTPDPILNQLFYFSKIRASESIYHSSLGLIHSPGGGNYYLGTWANDQVEYCGPFAPYLGYKTGNEAALNTYRHFKKNIPKDASAIPYSFEVDGNFVMNHLDRGDAAMIAYGTAHYALATGNLDVAEELWPLIEWSLSWCHNHRNSYGAVISESDEMEGRIETGTANLSTASLYYGGLKFGNRLAAALGKNKQALVYKNRQKEMANVIENYFGATMSGLETYKYFAENTKLRHWICLPMTMGITTRKEGTLRALFDKLWTENGILVEQAETDSHTLFWDRATLYALRGALKIGDTELAYEKLKSFSQKRLLGDHVPYVIEAYPENNMRHLSAESALYCRIVTEGFLGIEPTALDQFMMTPKLPKAWDFLNLKNLSLGGKQIDLDIRRSSEGYDLRIFYKNENITLDKKIKEGETVIVGIK